MKKHPVILGLALWGMAAMASAQVQVGVAVGAGGTVSTWPSAATTMSIPTR